LGGDRKKVRGKEVNFAFKSRKEWGSEIMRNYGELETLKGKAMSEGTCGSGPEIREAESSTRSGGIWRAQGKT